MDQSTLLTEQLEEGRRFVQEVVSHGIEVPVAFWAKLTDEGGWHLYLCLPLRDREGPKAAYRAVQDIVRQMPDLGIDPFEIRVLRSDDSLTEGALAAIRPRVPDDPFAVRSPRPYAGITNYRGSTLGGIEVDGAYIYPSLAAQS
jgi:hypothetical protein